MIRKMRESNDNVFYCAECTYDKSNGTMFLYTTDITEVRGSVKPKDSMKVEGGFLVRRKYFRSEYEAQEYIDSLPNATPMNRNESIRRSNKSMMIRKVNKLMEGNVYFDNDDLVFTVLEKYLSPRDASWLQRNKQGLCKGDKVFIGEHILGLIAHEYAIHKFDQYVANNVGSVASYFSVMKPLTIDIKTGRVSLPQCYLAASNLSRELKKQYNQLKWQLDEVFRDIAEEILVILDEDPIDRGEEIQYEYESMRRNRYRGLCTESSTAEDNKMFGLKNKAEVYDWYTMYYGKNKRYFEKWFEAARKSGAIKQCNTRLVPFKYFLNTDKILGVIEYDGTPFGSKENNYD